MSDVVERKLNLADTEGMFLLMAIGYVLAGSVLFSEIVGGCAKSCRAFIRRNSDVGQTEIVRRGSHFSIHQLELEEPKTFSDKLKRGIRRRLRSKPKPIEEPKKEETDEVKVEDETVKTTGIDGDEPVLKGPMSFCTIKRIMMMRKKRKDEQKAAKENKNKVIDLAKDETSNFENYHHFEDEAKEEKVRIKSAKSSSDSGDSGDGASLMGSSSIYSDTRLIREETEVEINQLTVANRENNPSKEFGEIV